MFDNNYKFSLNNLVKRVSNPSFDAVYLVYHYLFAKTKLFKYMYKKQLINKYNIFIFSDVVVGTDLKLPHPNGIVIGKGAVIGNNVTIYQQVTIGGKNIGDTKLGKIACIEDNVIIFAGVKILGDVTIGAGSKIGANAVLLKSTESDSIYAGIPAYKIK